VPFIEVRGVSKTFTQNGVVRRILDDVHLSIERGEFVSIVGFMGCGKSTLLSLLAGLQLVDAGRITIAGEVVRGVRKETAYVFQNYSLLPWLTSLDNVRIGVAAAFPEWPRAGQVAHARRYLELVGLGSAVHRRPGPLSGGMRQRVAIARAFATEPEILLLDEPFGALDALTRGNLQQELTSLCSSADRRVTTIMITNSVEEALLLSDRIVPMTAGPGATLGPPVSVAIPRPRTVAQIQHDEDALRARMHVVERLTDYVKHTRRRAPRVRFKRMGPEQSVVGVPLENET